MTGVLNETQIYHLLLKRAIVLRVKELSLTFSCCSIHNLTVFFLFSTSESIKYFIAVSKMYELRTSPYFFLVAMVGEKIKESNVICIILLLEYIFWGSIWNYFKSLFCFSLFLCEVFIAADHLKILGKLRFFFFS